MAEYIDYHKKFVAFDEGVKELCKHVPDLTGYFGTTLEENDVIQNLMEKYLENPYSTSNPNFPYTYSFRADSHGITFNTDKRVNFGWKARVDGKDGVYFTFHVSFPNSNKSVAQINLSKSGWETRLYTLGGAKKPWVKKEPIDK